jgi:hypothetical protein
MKISIIVGIVLTLDLILLTIVAFSSRLEVVSVLGDVAKLLAGALAGSMAGEKER